MNNKIILGFDGMEKDYKGFDKNITKEDLTSEELECYNNLMDGIRGASGGEQEEVAHLMEIFLETEEAVPTKCMRCKTGFKDKFKGASETNKRIYCDSCLEQMWSPMEKG